MGAVVGMEREWRHKASGLRTNMLICMGAALFTMLSGVLAGRNGAEQGAGGVEHRAGHRVSGRGTDSAHAQPRAGHDQRGDGVGGGGDWDGVRRGLYLEALIATAIVYCSLKFIGLLESTVGLEALSMMYEVRGIGRGHDVRRDLRRAGYGAAAAEHRGAREAGRAGARHICGLGEQRRASRCCWRN